MYFWKEIGGMSKTDALAQLEKFFYQDCKTACFTFLDFGIRVLSLKA
jgi:hypothetical protein